MESEPPTETAQIGESDMCEFCDKGKRDIILNDDGSIICLTADAVIAIDKDTGKKHKNQMAINYCPICGRKLVEE